MWMALVAIRIRVPIHRVRLQLLTASGRDWNIESFYSDACLVVEIMDHINACVCARAEITKNDDLGCVDFLGDVADPAALAEAISAVAKTSKKS
jgi:hypothetical protein